MTGLFLNCCIRGEVSRTLRLCRTAQAELSRCNPSLVWQELVLSEQPLLPLNGARLAERHALEETGDFSHPMFRYGKELAAADWILIGAPFWEGSFPSLLRVYLEQCSVVGLTFAYQEDSGRPYGLCRAKQMLYVTTAGGPLFQENLGFAFLRQLFTLFGVPQCRELRVEGLDVVGADVSALMADGERRLLQLIREERQ